MFCSLLLLSALTVGSVSPAQNQPTHRLLMSDLATDGTQVLFYWTGRLWTIPMEGGQAQPVFPDEQSRIAPEFSPDGKLLAFTNFADGDVYVRMADGAERRLTYHPKLDLVRGWTPDGRSIVFSSSREMDGQMELYSVAIAGGTEEKLPIPRADTGCFGKDANRMAYVPHSIFGTTVNRRFYRGGSMSQVHLLDLKSGSRKPVSEPGVNTFFPRWIGDQLVAINDRLASFNLVSYDLTSGKRREYTDFTEHGITSMTALGGFAFFVRNGQLFRCDLASGAIKGIPVRFDPETLAKLDQRQSKSVPVSRAASSLMPSFDGKAVAIEARGNVVIWNRDGTAKTFGNGSQSAERLPVLSPDNSKVAYFSDEGGEYRLVIETVADRKKTVIPVESASTFYSELEWSPDGARLCFSDQRVSLWIADVAGGRARKIDESKHMAQGSWNPDWSPDGKWLTYSKALPNRVRTIHLLELAAGRTIQVTDGMTQAEFPVFDRSGRYLYFSGSNNARNASAHDIGWALMSDFRQQMLTTKKLNLVVLSKSDVSPVSPVADLPSLLKPSAIRIDTDGIQRRIVPLPLAPRDIADIEAGKPGTVFIASNAWDETPGLLNSRTTVVRYSLAAPRVAPVVSEASSFEVSGDGSTLLTVAGSVVQLLDAEAAPVEKVLPGLTCDFSKVNVDVDVKAEWSQMFGEAFRMMRDIFYDPKHHGRDVVALEKNYREYLDMILQRPLLNSLLLRAFGEVSVSHLQVGGGDAAPPSRPTGAPVGLLGADYAVAGGRIQFKKVYRNGDYMSDNSLLRAPLDQPGIDVRDGDFLIAVQGEEVKAEDNVHRHFVGTLGRPTKIKVASSASGANAREYTVVPIAGENGLRRANWAQENREMVDKLSGGRLTYCFIGEHSPDGFNEFSRVFNASPDKAGMIIDQRFNGGGITADYQIEALLRKPILAYDYRHGGEIVFPSNRIDGPKVLINNEGNGSAAETFALMFRSAGVGKIVGMPTYGGGIGAALFQQQLVDGGRIFIPNRAGYNPLTGKWEIENEGVKPDVRVDRTPEDYLAGRDRQLEEAVRLALEELKTYRKPTLKKPMPPTHKGG